MLYDQNGAFSYLSRQTQFSSRENLAIFFLSNTSERERNMTQFLRAILTNSSQRLFILVWTNTTLFQLKPCHFVCLLGREGVGFFPLEEEESKKDKKYQVCMCVYCMYTPVHYGFRAQRRPWRLVGANHIELSRSRRRGDLFLVPPTQHWDIFTYLSICKSSHQSLATFSFPILFLDHCNPPTNPSTYPTTPFYLSHFTTTTACNPHQLTAWVSGRKFVDIWIHAFLLALHIHTCRYYIQCNHFTPPSSNVSLCTCITIYVSITTLISQKPTFKSDN